MMDMEKLSNCLDSGKDDDVMLPGFRFHPTDEELVGFYLRRKVEKKPLNIELIKHIDIYKYDPWDLPKVSTVGDKEWYFFCIRERKYRNSIRPNRVTGSGFWKATGIDRPVYSVGSEPPHDCIGLKKSLVYYRGSAGKGTKTDWMMHEFRLPPGDKISSKLPNSKSTTAAAEEAEIWTLCRIFKRNVSYKKFLPNWRATNSAPIKQTVTESSSTSQTCSFESVNIDKYTSFGPSVVVQQMKEKKPVVNHINEKSHVFADQLSSVSTNHHHHHHDPVAAISSNFPNSNNGNNDFFRDGNWDELGRMLEFSSDSSFLYNCR